MAPFDQVISDTIPVKWNPKVHNSKKKNTPKLDEKYKIYILSKYAKFGSLGYLQFLFQNKIVANQ